MRVRFTRDDHGEVPPGRGGYIDQIHPIEHDWFVVYTDCGGMFMWTSFASWQPTDEPDVVLSDDYRAMREATTPTAKGRR